MLQLEKKYVNSRTDEKVDLVSDGTRLKFSGSGLKIWAQAKKNLLPLLLTQSKPKKQ